jgi:hypothetical protein
MLRDSLSRESSTMRENLACSDEPMVNAEIINVGPGNIARSLWLVLHYCTYNRYITRCHSYFTWSNNCLLLRKTCCSLTVVLAPDTNPETFGYIIHLLPQPPTSLTPFQFCDLNTHSAQTISGLKGATNPDPLYLALRDIPTRIQQNRIRNTGSFGS